MTSCTCRKCMSCGAISVVLTKDLWKLRQCPKCESKDLVNLDEEFELAEVIKQGEEKDGKFTRKIQEVL